MNKVLEFFCPADDHEQIHRIILTAFDQPCVVPPHKAREQMAVMAAKADDMFIQNKVTYLSEQSRTNTITFRAARHPDERIKFVMDVAKSPVIEFHAPYQRPDHVFVAGAFRLPSRDSDLQNKFAVINRLFAKNFLHHTRHRLYVSPRIALDTARFFVANHVHGFALHELAAHTIAL